MMLAIDEGIKEMVGLCCFLPVEVSIHGVEEKAYRPFGAIIKESFRERFGLASLLTGNHPILQLYKHGAKQAVLNNAAITYLIPDHRWERLSAIMPFQSHRFPLWSIDLPLNQDWLEDAHISIKKSDVADVDIDLLWKRSSKDGFCMLSKKSKFYESKIHMRHGSVQLWTVHKSSTLIALFTLHFKADERHWLIGDLLSLDYNESLTLLIKAACKAAQLEYDEKKLSGGKIFKVSILANSIIQERVTALGFYKEKYNFLFAVHLLNGRFSEKEVAPEKWFVSAND
jgi:hypothetical protein